MEDDKYCTIGEKNNLYLKALSKIVYLTLMTSFSKNLIEEMQKIQKAFIWNNLLPKSNMKLRVALLKKVAAKMLT